GDASAASGGMFAGAAGASNSGGRAPFGGADNGGRDAGRGGAAFAGGAGEAEAGSAGDATDPGTCAATVPADGVTGALQAAIDAASVPSTLCLKGGGHRGDVTLRAGVSLRGEGWATIICGTVNGDAATSGMTTLSQLQIAGEFSAGGSVKLSLRDLEINTGHTAVCAPASTATRFIHDGAGALQLLIDGVTIGSPGFEIAIEPGVGPIDDNIVLRNSRCDSTSQCYDFLRFTFDTAPAAQVAAGSRIVLDVYNNVVRNVVLEGVVFELRGGMNHEDSASSRLWFRHNTLASAGDLNSAVAFWTEPTLPVVLANNAIAYIAKPVLGGDALGITDVGNVYSDDESSTAWFDDFPLGDFSPSAGSPLIGAGADAYGVPTDITGKARTGGFDSGAYQR
ncbi:MAG TPA: hypothetical protein VNN72_02255, partial [Polyangiaceae bacterium]|nr:hypothetical protein [Polyangiaceae bacterium]